ncbi:MAG: MraY family glycosyltransferase [Verrucomicrobiota bacterium]|nr:MraY family glycosyltransferase [Verrucomicrobiota bacterium]
MGSDISSQIEGIKHVWNQLLIIFLGATALVFVGMYDDRAPIGPLPKFAAQFWVAGATACWGVRITLFWNIPVFTWIVTTLWIMLIINAINFFDNMDGLTAGTSAIASFLFFFVASVNHQYFVATLSAITFGSTLGFWFHNRYPAKIYMGDAGSHFLGYMLAVIGALTTFHSKETPTPFAVLIPLCILLLPIFDLLLVMGIRKKIGKPIYRGDHNHISHRFHKMGLSKTNSVRCVHLLSLALGLGVLPMMWLGFKGILVILLQFSAIFAFIIIISTVHIRDIIEDE